MSAESDEQRAWSPAAAMLVLLLLAASIQGCSRGALRPEPPPFLPNRSIKLDTVQGFRQQDRQCGAAALASVLRWSDVPVTPQILATQVANPAREGALQHALTSCARRHGRLAYPIQSPEELFAELRAGRPVLVLQNLGLSWMPVHHYSVVRGYDAERRELVLLFGEEKPRRQPWRTFLAAWSRSGQWGLVVLRPGTLPASPDKDRYLQAAIGLEKAGLPAAAAQAYQAALRLWPHSASALIGLGNSRYALGQLAKAERAFRTCTQLHPRSGIAWNNLAQTLLEQGQARAARRAASKAVSLGGPHQSAFESTLERIERRIRPSQTAPGE